MPKLTAKVTGLHRNMVAPLQDCPQPNSGKKVAMNEDREMEA